jgi:hypothetical protein
MIFGLISKVPFLNDLNAIFYFIHLRALSIGLHNITVYATDTFGNTGASKTIYFSIEPFPVEWIAAAVVSVAVGAGLLFYFKKRNH